MKRTDEQKQAFAMKCLAIENDGGDVLGYIEKNWPSYTPRATWYSLQKQYLNRNVAHLTEGRPKEKRGVMAMGKMMDMASEAMDAYARGESIYDWLEAHGYKNASSIWYQMKQTAMKTDPDLYDRMCDAITATKRKPKPRKTAEQLMPPAKPKEEPKEIPKAGEPMPVTLQGKQITTCCAPARESGVTVPDEIPENPYQAVNDVAKRMIAEAKDAEPMEIVGVRSRVKGYYMKAEVNPGLTESSGYVHLIWRDLVTREERSIGLSVEDWKKLAEEIPQAMKQLGF